MKEYQFDNCIIQTDDKEIVITIRKDRWLMGSTSPTTDRVLCNLFHSKLFDEHVYDVSLRIFREIGRKRKKDYKKDLTRKINT